MSVSFFIDTRIPEIDHNKLALLRIHTAGWVHRDISTGNIYLYVDSVTGEKRGMLGDLEFSKKVGTGARYDVRTVCNILDTHYLFLLLARIIDSRVHLTSWLSK